MLLPSGNDIGLTLVIPRMFLVARLTLIMIRNIIGRMPKNIDVSSQGCGMKAVFVWQSLAAPWGFFMNGDVGECIVLLVASLPTLHCSPGCLFSYLYWTPAGDSLWHDSQGNYSSLFG